MEFDFTILENFLTEQGIDQHEAIKLVKQGMKHVEGREKARVRELERRHEAAAALKFYREQQAAKLSHS